MGGKNPAAGGVSESQGIRTGIRVQGTHQSCDFKFSLHTPTLSFSFLLHTI